MAELLAAFAAPHAVQAAYAALSIAWQQYQIVKGNKERCKVLLQRCQNLLIAVGDQIQREGLPESMMDNLHILENVCSSIKNIITKLASHSFAWRLLHQDKTDGDIKATEAKLLDAIAIFDMSAHIDSARLQREIADSMAQAAATDQLELVAHLNNLSENDYRIMHALQENHIRIEELLVALTKHVQDIQSPVSATTSPTEKFIRHAVGALQRLSNEPASKVSVWQVTSLEVTFNRDDLTSRVGQGSFGTVFQGQWQGEVVAVKEMYTEDARSIDRNVLKTVHNEIAIWSRLTHPRIVQFYGACLEATRPFMVSRFCSNGNVLDYLKKNPSEDRLKLLFEVSLGMTYLHSQSVIHADLKGANILIDSEGKALISDFGISQLKDQTGTSSLNRTGMETTKGTLRWMAPELLEGEKLNFPADVYTFGITSWEVYTLEVPFSDIPERAFFRRVIDKQERPKCPQTMGDELVQLLSRCWAHEAVERPTFRDVSRSLSDIVAKNDRERRLKAIQAKVEEEKIKKEQEAQAAIEKKEREEREARKEQERIQRLRHEAEVATKKREEQAAKERVAAEQKLREEILEKLREEKKEKEREELAAQAQAAREQKKEEERLEKLRRDSERAAAQEKLKKEAEEYNQAQARAPQVWSNPIREPIGSPSLKEMERRRQVEMEDNWAREEVKRMTEAAVKRNFDEQKAYRQSV